MIVNETIIFQIIIEVADESDVDVTRVWRTKFHFYDEFINRILRLIDLFF